MRATTVVHQAAAILGLFAGCVVNEICVDANDCAEGTICHAPTGRCVATQCQTASDCATDHACHVRTCVPRQTEPLDCPTDMASIDDVFCMDLHEASRPDATDDDAGGDSSRATSRPGMLPWQVETNQQAQTACTAAGKDLCTAVQWQAACEGPETTIYAYGDVYDPVICNGIDRFCRCGADTGCADEAVCPFPGCYHRCGADFRVLPTGASRECRGPHGVFDLNGNLWEHVKGGDASQVRGGAFNCSDSERFHRCDYVPSNWAPLALGFRCCTSPAP